MGYYHERIKDARQKKCLGETLYSPGLSFPLYNATGKRRTIAAKYVAQNRGEECSIAILQEMSNTVNKCNTYHQKGSFLLSYYLKRLKYTFFYFAYVQV
jgi:hypothetical protein